MTDDVRLLLSRLDEPVAVRPAFAEGLRQALHAELGFAAAAREPGVASAAVVVAPPLVPDRHPSLLERIAGSLRPMTPRVALLIAIALLLIACTVAGAWIVASGWVSSAPRGPQYTNDFTFTEAVREPGVSFTGLQLGPDGQSIYTVGQTMEGTARTDPTIVRFDASPDGTLTRHDVLRLETLTDPALWPPGTDVGSGRITLGPANPGTSAIAVAPDGDLFVGMGLSTDPERTPVSPVVVVVHPDGSAQRVISIDELTGRGLIDQPIDGGWVTVAASAADHLWAKAEGWKTEGATTDGGAWLFEITDPTADGDWTDKVIRPVVLPADVPVVTWGDYGWQYAGFVAEPSTGGHDRSGSALLSLLGTTEYRVYRLTDPDGSGDVTAPGETEAMFSGALNTSEGVLQAPLLAPRIVGEGEPVIDELVAAGLTRSTRVSRISGSRVTDILRALPSAWGVAATRDGSIYVASFEDDPGGNPSGGAGLISRLAPVPVGAPLPTSSPATTGSSDASAAASRSPGSSGGSTPGDGLGTSPAPSVATLLPPREPLTDGEPRIGIWFGGTTASGDWLNEAVFMAADGSGPSDLVPGTHTMGLCPSADGARIAFWSDEEVPNESYLYVDAVDGGARQMITETANMIACPFPDEGIVTLTTTQAPWRATWHPANGEASRLALDIAPDGFLATTDDGAWIALATGSEGHTLTVIDARTGQTSTVAQLDDRVRRAAWSADGTRLAIATGPYDPLNPEATATFDVAVVDRAGGEPVHLLAVEGHGPDLVWSPDGRSLAVNSRSGATTGYATAGDLVVVDVATGATREIATDVVFAGWSPVDPATFAYATLSTLVIDSAGSSTRELTGPTGKLCPGCDDRTSPRWPYFGLGWSPDGRYIGTGDSIVGVVDVATGEYRVVLTDGDESLVYSSRWWPLPGR